MPKQKNNLLFYTREQVAQILQLHPMTVYRMVQRGELKAYNFGTDMRIREEDFNEFLKRSLIRPGMGKSIQPTVKPRKTPKMAKQRPTKKMLANKKIKRSKQLCSPKNP